MAHLELVRCDVRRGKRRALVPYLHHALADLPPALVPAPDGQRLGITCRNALEDVTRVVIVSRREGQVVGDVLTWIPGAEQHAFPCWSPQGRSLALWMVNVGLDRTGLVVVKGLAGEGEIFYQRDGLDEPVQPAWEPGGRAIWLLGAGGQLLRLDLDRRQPEPVGAPGLAGEVLRFGPDGALVLEGGPAVYRLSAPGG